jgi:hypothetical protein
MTLKMRPAGLSSGHYKDSVDYGVFCGEWCIGRIYENRSGPEHMRWFWALHCPSKPACASRTKLRRWKRRRQSTAGHSGRAPGP